MIGRQLLEGKSQEPQNGPQSGRSTGIQRLNAELQEADMDQLESDYSHAIETKNTYKIIRLKNKINLLDIKADRAELLIDGIERYQERRQQELNSGPRTSLSQTVDKSGDCDSSYRLSGLRPLVSNAPVAGPRGDSGSLMHCLHTILNRGWIPRFHKTVSAAMESLRLTSNYRSFSVRKIALLVVASLCFSGSVFADDSRPRLHLTGTGALVMQLDDTVAMMDRASGETVGSVDMEFDAGRGLLLLVGYGQKVGIRGELELGYREFSIDRIRNLRLGNFSYPNNLEMTGDVKAYSVMGNFVSSMTVGMFDLYVGAGVGMARLKTATSGIAGISFDEISARDEVFAYQFFAGLQYEFTDDLTGKAGYRYFATRDADFDGSVMPVRTHNFEIGLTHWLQ